MSEQPMNKYAIHETETRIKLLIQTQEKEVILKEKLLVTLEKINTNIVARIARIDELNLMMEILTRKEPEKVIELEKEVKEKL